MSKLFKRLVSKVRMLMIDKPLPSPSEREIGLVTELRHAFKNFSPIEALNVPPSEAEWIRNLNSLRESIIDDDPREFLRWDVIRKTMFVASGPAVENELNFLKSRPNWDEYWSRAIIESSVGHPLPCLYHPDSSGNLIHHAYHLAQFEEKAGVRAEQMDFVFEFGGGYGSMCRLFHNLGFHGKYVVFDLPYFSMLQQFYLESLGIPLILPSEPDGNKGVICISDIDQLKSELSNASRMNNAMFVATWSISEVPLYLRDAVLPLVSNFNSFLIGYQNRFGEVDNSDFFNTWRENFNKKIVWQDWPISHIPGNNYLVGRKRE